MRVIIGLMTAMGVLGMTAWLILFGSCRKILCDIRNGKHSTPLVKKMISKYVDCKKLDINVQNVRAFVEKMLDTERICGLNPKMLVSIGVGVKYLLIMTMIIGMFVFKGNYDAAYVVLTTGLITALALHLCEKLTDYAGVHRRIVVEMVDFLENSGDVVLRERKYKPTCSKLTGRAAAEFEKMSRQYDRLNRKQEKIVRTNAFVLKNNRQML